MHPTHEESYENNSDTNSDDFLAQIAHLALEFQDSEDRQLRPALTQVVREVPNQCNVGEDPWLLQEHAYVMRQLQDGFDADDWERLRQLQNEFDAEDQRLRQEQEKLACCIRTTFQCSICMDELPEDDIAKIDGCMHTMCRTCLRKFVSSKIKEHRYPIFCPVCIAERDKKGEPSIISRALIEQLGVSEEQSLILTEMELTQFTVQIHCRKCRRSAFLDREDYAEMINIVCPQSNCHYVWCKKCERKIVADGPQHSCDGSSELEHLMKRKGWKHCPNCTTPIMKETGCNHMLCVSPACNTHFCYVCGGMIVRSALAPEINTAVTEHYGRCQLFEVPD